MDVYVYICVCVESTQDVMITVMGLEMATQVQILDEAVSNFGKGWFHYSPYSYRQIVRLTELFNLSMATSLEEGKLNLNR